ncbi:hypothetical protein [Gracilibacillus alcaliphilus]|uniref:hypothetical protein n=1 Tax=Gracilibacillus alcaliphilus TaxID=1401441 RepID=UPI00195F134F|nr:hypothetical protein [Gracilibacillus alcaliphilus]MBM7679312.1 hypothetical protein [Gracilibacillus alcaliphilus]
MAKVKMLVQSTYNKELLRAGKIYEVNDETAQRWQVSKIAEMVEESVEEQKTDQ